MTLRLKLIFLAILEIILTVSIAGYFGYRESRSEIEKLAKDLTKSKTQEAFSLIDQYYKNGAEFSDELREKIASIQIANEGYIAVIDNMDGPQKGKLVIHPSNEGLLLYNDNFPHIVKILNEIDENGKLLGFGNFTHYRQQTIAKGRKGEMKIGYFKYFSPWNFVILATGYERDIFASRVIVRNSTIQVIILVSLIGILAVSITTRQMFKPVQRLTESTKEVAKGNWEISIDNNSNDEIGILSDSFNKMVKSLRENTRIWHEFKVAQEMQAKMLPDSCPKMVGIKISAKSIPAKQVGGDFYDFLTLKSQRLGIIIGDVSGHGISAAMVMAAAMSTIRFAAEANEQTDLVLQLANSRLKKDIQKNMFVALFYGIIDLRNRQIHYTNAGLPLPLLWRKGKVNLLPQTDESDRFPLGLVDRCIYKQLSFDLNPGDILIFYTDGIIETMNACQESYDFERFSASICQHIQLDPTDIIENLINDMTHHIGSIDLYDDVTLVVVKIE